MAYQTGAVSSISDLLNKFAIFGAANGWPVSKNYTAGTGSPRVVEFVRGGKYWVLAEATAHGQFSLQLQEAALSGSPAYSTFFEDDRRTFGHIIGTGPYVAHHFFTSGNSIFGVVEYSAGKFLHFGIGDITKAGTWDGGAWVASTFWYLDPPNYNRAQNPSDSIHSGLFDSFYSQSASTTGSGKIRRDYVPGTPYYIAICGSQTTPQLYFASGADRPGNSMIPAFPGNANRNPNTVNGRSILCPETIISRDPSNNYWQVIGVIDGAFAVDVDNLAPGDIVDTDYKTFPLCCKNGTLQENSGTFGIAFKMS